MKKSTNNIGHPKPTKSEEKAKQHLISVGLYGSSVSVVSNAFRFTAIFRNFSENKVLKEFNLSFSGFVVMWVLWVWGDLETAKLAKNAGVDILVSGTTIFKENNGNLEKNIQTLRDG